VLDPETTCRREPLTRTNVLKLGRRGLVDLADGRVPYRLENKPINFRK